MLSQPSTCSRCPAKVACTNWSSLLMGVIAIVSVLPSWYQVLPSDRDLPVHQARQEEVAGTSEIFDLLFQNSAICSKTWFDMLSLRKCQ